MYAMLLCFASVDHTGIRTIARMDTTPNDIIPNGHHPEWWTPSEMDIIPNGHHPNGHHP